MEEFYKRICAYLKALIVDKPFIYRFMMFDGSEANNQIPISNSIEYEFINYGTTVIVINDALELYPLWAQLGITRWKGTLNKNEVDETIYQYNFRKLEPHKDFTGGFISDDTGGGFVYNPSDGLDFGGNPIVPANRVLNRLIVVLKEKSSAGQELTASKTKKNGK